MHSKKPCLDLARDPNSPGDTEVRCGASEHAGHPSWEKFITSNFTPLYDFPNESARALSDDFTYAFEHIRGSAGEFDVLELGPCTLRMIGKRLEDLREPVAVLVMFSGNCTVVCGQHTERLPRDRAILFDPCQPIVLTVPERAKFLLITVNADYFLTHVGVQPSELFGMSFGLKSAAERCFTRAARVVGDLLGQMSAAEAAEFCDGLFCFLRPTAMRVSANATLRLTKSRDRLRLAAQNVLARRLADTALRVTDVAEELGVSKSYLERIFRETGTSVRAELQAMRLERCRVQLVEPHQVETTIETIALRNGFRSAAHFSRAFRERYRYSPNEWRKLHDEGDRTKRSR